MALSLEPAPDDFLRALKSRSHGLNITTADSYLREFEACLDGACPSNILQGVTPKQWRGVMKRASRTAVYQGEGIRLESVGNVKEGSLPAGIKLPPKTAGWVNTIVTTPTQDRDGDILETLGAHLFPRSSHLFNHLPTENVGRLIKETAHTKELLSALLSLMQTEFAENVAVMYEHGSLQTSHGFLPKKWAPLKSGEGFHIIEFDILEISGVSVPSNPDAGPIEFSRNKLTHPLLKEWGRMKFRQRKPIAAVGIDLSALPPGTTIVLPDKPPAHDKGCTCQQHKDFPVMPAIPFKDAPVSKSDSWDADAAVKGIRTWAGVDRDEPSAAAWSKYAEAFALREGDTDNLTSYKLPYKQVEDGKLVINPKGVSAGIGALNGGRGGGMDISEGDRKGAYDVLAKAYKKAYPDQDAPELKAIAEFQTKGVYVDLPGSYERIRDQLAAKLRPYLLYKGKAGEADWCSLVATYSDHGVASILEDAMMPGQGCCLWDDANAIYCRIPWASENGEPNWTGEPIEVPVTDLLSGAAKSAFEIFAKGFAKRSHIKSLEKASDHLQKAVEHDDATAGTTFHAKRAKGHVDAVVDAHTDDEKGMVTSGHIDRLKKAMGYCQKGMDHKEATEPVAKYFKSAHGFITKAMEGMDDSDEGGEASVAPATKGGRTMNAANEKKLNTAKAHLKAIADDDEAHSDVRQSASDGASSIDSIFVIGEGGDAGQDYDGDGNYVGTDVGAYTDGEPNKATGEMATGEKSGRAISKRSAGLIEKAIGHAQAIIDHNEAGEDHKGLATAAKAKLSSVMGKKPSSEGPAMGTDPSTPEPGQAEEKSLGDRANELADEFRFAVAEGDEQKMFDVIEAAGAIQSLIESVKTAQIDVDLSLAESQIDRDLDAAEMIGA